MKLLQHILLVWMMGIAVTVQSQDSTRLHVTDVAGFEDSIYLSKCLLLTDSNNIIPPAVALNREWQQVTTLRLTPRIPASWLTKRIYLQFAVSNSSAATDTVWFLPGLSFRSIRLFEIHEGNTLKQLQDESRTTGYQPVVMPAGSNRRFIAELCPTRNIFVHIAPQLIQHRYLDKYKRIYHYKNAAIQKTGFVFSGILIMMFIYSMANYLLSKKKEFLLNGLYVSCMCLLIFFSVCFEKRGGIFVSFFMGYAAFALLAAGTVFYIAFTRKFLDTEKNFPRLNTLFIYEERAVLLLLSGYSIVYFFTDYFFLQQAFENVMKITALAVGIVYIVTAATQKNKLLNYLAVGNALLILFSIVSFYFLMLPKRGSIFYNSLLYYETGIVLELLFFMLGLTYKNRVELIDKIREQEALKLESEKQSYEAKLAVLDAKQKERNRISADMHDELGAGITAIRLYSELAKSKPHDTMPEIEKISASANELLNNMNTIIWAMSSNNDSLENMVAYIRSYSLEYFDNSGVQCRVEIDGNLPELGVSGAIRKNIFMVVKEALSNIMKHAGATEVNIRLKKESNGLTLYIQDNGTGIELEKTRRFGNGLKNMKHRMEESGINFSIQNNNGTLIKLHYEMPL